MLEHTDGRPATQPAHRQEWRDWLARNHATVRGVWLISYKKSSGKPRLTYEEAVEEALCFGWVDSRPSKLDAERTMLWFSPRKRGSAWSALNKARVERLIAEGLMTPAGLSKIEEARADGSWSRLDEVDALVVPDDLDTALRRYPHALVNFQAFPPSARRGILEWIVQAKQPTTRARRVEETARLASQKIRANQPRQPKSTTG